MNDNPRTVLAAIALRQMTDSPRDLDAALHLSRGAGWPYRRDDWRLALALGQGVLAEASGEIVASALWWPYSDAFATCGIIIVAPSMQGRGLGRTLMQRVLDATGERAVLLNSTDEGHRLYAAFGFKDIGTVHQHRAQTTAGSFRIASDLPVRAARAGDLPGILQLDRRAFGAERRDLIDAFARIGTAAVIDRGSVVQGFAFCRPFGLGHAIGPVIARDTEDAKALIGHFLTTHAGQFLRLDIAGDSGLAEWLTAQGLPDVGSVTTMIRGPRPPLSGPERIFALASQSFG